MGIIFVYNTITFRNYSSLRYYIKKKLFKTMFTATDRQYILDSLNYSVPIS